MPQAFQRRANTITKISLLAATVSVAGLLGGVMAFGWSPWMNGKGAVKTQPVPYSHALHVGKLGIDCRYCHTGVETSAMAGIPPTKTCMNCHSIIGTDSASLAPVRLSDSTNTPMQWVRVHDLPDFAYFNHSIHIDKGVGCATCHGRIDQMPVVKQQASLQMDWCLGCHTHPEQFVRPRSEVFNMAYEKPANQTQLGDSLVAAYKIRHLTDCTTCHR